MEIVKMTLIIRLLKIAANFRSSVILTLCGERFSQVSPTLDKVPTMEQLKVCGLDVGSSTRSVNI